MVNLYTSRTSWYSIPLKIMLSYKGNQPEGLSTSCFGWGRFPLDHAVWCFCVLGASHGLGPGEGRVVSVHAVAGVTGEF